ncbi:hypothetical protein KQY30_25740 [Streptomyces sp. GMY02]|uniref:DUF7439 family protein n=1 Tax=Streptomyces sp. GMY02 TaxID=1333528 RepID=UPI001C2C7848|nr:hypothetical protein [Streptomyces sp. GMY02]QXE37114.1 hypothetical protein KQY30_25740 [Streptomyces sp. GMY02]
MSKIRGPIAAVVNALPVRYRTRVGAVIAALGVLVSIGAVVFTDQPEVAVIVQFLTALGVVVPDDSEDAE